MIISTVIKSMQFRNFLPLVEDILIFLCVKIVAILSPLDFKLVTEIEDVRPLILVIMFLKLPSPIRSSCLR